tara:strand:+ start:11295 stop:12002 length:708 start_codon:yes stop_codon:yes gene_type:complete
MELKAKENRGGLITTIYPHPFRRIDSHKSDQKEWQAYHDILYNRRRSLRNQREAEQKLRSNPVHAHKQAAFKAFLLKKFGIPFNVFYAWDSYHSNGDGFGLWFVADPIWDMRRRPDHDAGRAILQSVHAAGLSNFYNITHLMVLAKLSPQNVIAGLNSLKRNGQIWRVKNHVTWHRPRTDAEIEQERRERTRQELAQQEAYTSQIRAELLSRRSTTLFDNTTTATNDTSSGFLIR